MGEENGNVERRRGGLGDVTNLPAKRGLSSVLGCAGKSEDADSRLAKQQMCFKEMRNSYGTELSLIKYGDENEETSNSVKVRSVGDAGEVSRDSSASTPTSYLPCNKDEDDATKLFALTRCTAYQGDAHLPKPCSCSFCIKAAYIWSDLHYQDIKGRIAALKKSQKEASILLNKYDTGKLTDNSSKLESNLTGLWKSLFHHTEDIFVQESSQLKTSFVSLRDLRDDCKMDLERITGMPSDGY